MAGPTVLTVNHEEISILEDVPDLYKLRQDWGTEWEEILGSEGRATIYVLDFHNSWEPVEHWDVKLTIRNGPLAGWVLFRGEIDSWNLELRVGQDIRIWKLDCKDYRGQFPQRLVGALDGKTWQDIDGLGIYVNIDPHARTLATDKLTIQDWFDHYIRVDGEAIGTSTYVDELYPDLPTQLYEYETLESVLDDLARRIADNVQSWLDPDLEFHWHVIPSWRDLLQQVVAAEEDVTNYVGIPGMLPELGAPGTTVIRPTPTPTIGDQPGYLRCRELTIDSDGSQMPQQLYVRGGTDFVYNAAQIDPVGETVVINPEGYGTKSTEVLQLTFLGTTKVWTRQSNGLISSSFTNASAGGPYDVKFVLIPYNPANGKGGCYWQLLEGPNVGKYVDNDTNYFGYGSIRVEKHIPTVTEPSVGVGGTGWVGDAVQDKNKRQAYLQAAVSTTESLRDSIGGQVLYRAEHATMRARLTITAGNDDEDMLDPDSVGEEGWRVGQMMHLADERLPSDLTDRDYIVQSVKGKLIPGTDLREYTLGFGDGPESRYSYEPTTDVTQVDWPPGATMVEVRAFDLSPGTSSTQMIIGQLIARDGTPWRIAGKLVQWTLEVYTADGTLVNEGSIDPEASATDQNGQARTILTSSSQPGRVHFVFGAVAAN